MEFTAKKAVPVERRSFKLAVCPFFDRASISKERQKKARKKFKKNPDKQSKVKFLAAIKRCKMSKRKKTEFFEAQVNQNVNPKYSSFNMLMGVKTTEKLPVGRGTDSEIAQKFNTSFEEKVTKIKSY